ELKGLVPDNLSGNTKYLDPVLNLNRVAAALKKEKACDMVICLSHPVYRYKPDEQKISDEILARETENIDYNWWTHTYLFR
ncbi:MAG: hypothetical protein LH615_16460, partial [Ferruginibacter sp.]|nr:hypothetical protein [Ferruginibacter sp.]